MTRSLAQILREADEVIEKIASGEPSAPAENSTDDLFKLAEQLRAEPQANEVSSEPPFEMTGMEKMALAIAVVETAISSKELHSLSNLEKAAEEKGIPQEKVQDFFAKVAEKNPVGRRAISFVEETARGLQEYCAAR